MKLDEFLSHKPFFYKEIDYTRMPRAWDSIKNNLKHFKIIHIIGTNGKGSTGRFLAQILRLSGKSVGHYTSPHIFEFSERFWLNGDVVGSQILESAHERLQTMLSDELKVKTSYFEYATLLAAVLFSECDYFVCECGMGGELDATNVFDKILSVFTPIGLDHTAVLGDTIEQISTTKFKAMQENSQAILNDEMNSISTHVAFLIAASKRVRVNFASEILEKDDIENIKKYAIKFSLPYFLISNLSLAVAASKRLINKIDITNLDELNLRGRCEKVAENIYVDVGHNELAALAIAQKFIGKKLVLIYNSFADKDYRSVLKTLKPIIKRVEIYQYESGERELATDEIRKTLNELNIEHRDFLANIDNLHENKDELYLAFGSFYLVEAFLRRFNASKNL
ncbi:Mur ligase family protein [Campylobacter sp. RM16192]|uniref:Mur ligase family protein n=1 Tax=Campylobacter sp. RM16192 TaxID=1660080 RepID=UPI0014527DD4|nr:Mur ligase family protein [Campylobacter sp. RM16192]QCD52302.1 bifunctional folypolyglutamate synthetase / dihydrofolate synthetase [Campylobacter sp. RM16192]